MDDQPDAISEGRRIYLGNILYSIQPHDIEKVLADHGFGAFEQIHISVDPVSARNPGYCFVDFRDRDTAQRALSSLRASIRGRTLKVGPCEPKKPRVRRDWPERDSGAVEDRFVFQRWGDWKSAGRTNKAGDGGEDASKVEQGPQGALHHFKNILDGYEGRRLYVGGLGRMVDQEQNHGEVSELFADFKPTAIGKRITPHESTRSKPGNHHYCFVDFETRDEAGSAMRALNGKPYLGGKLRVSVATNIPAKLIDRRTEDLESPRTTDAAPESSGAPSRAFASMNWRRKDE
ncbi:hypothetical protein RJ55_04228 [Drechmeria coniospora]|nr:hypothetical protein RJ55_04228 [Drechmeria coniospora]